MVARLVLLALLVMPAACLAAASSVPGTYEVRICGSSCADGPAVAEGRLVLLAAPLRDASGAPLMVGGMQPGNGCFRFARFRPHGLIGHSPAGTVIWSHSRPHSISVNFTPDGIDAFYIVNFQAAPGRMTGTGASDYASEPRPAPLPPDVVVARRVGPADPTQCK